MGAVVGCAVGVNVALGVSVWIFGVKVTLGVTWGWGVTEADGLQLIRTIEIRKRMQMIL
jgi:hypothetical protein